MQQDFHCHLLKLSASKILDAEKIPQYKNLFCDKWPSIAKKIVHHYNSKSCRCPEIKIFLSTNLSLVGQYDDILALMLISFSSGVTKKKETDQEKIFLSRAEISKTFILHVLVSLSNNFQIEISCKKI